jgi:two-component sensor histidine kinase
MSIDLLKGSLDPPDDSDFGMAGSRSVASYERELFQHRNIEARLRDALAQDKTLLDRKDAELQQQALLSHESDHRLLNDLQMIVSLLSLQGRASGNIETAGQLKIAADRVGMIVRLHRRLHSHDGAPTVAFKQYLDELCLDFSAMTSAGGTVDVIFDSTDEIELPAAIGIPLGFIVSELLTNAAKHGKSRIAVRFGASAEGGYELSVSNDGDPLPKDFDPRAGKGLGMKIIKSFVDRIGGKLTYDCGAENLGACFAITFSCPEPFKENRS